MSLGRCAGRTIVGEGGSSGSVPGLQREVHEHPGHVWRSRSTGWMSGAPQYSFRRSYGHALTKAEQSLVVQDDVDVSRDNCLIVISKNRALRIHIANHDETDRRAIQNSDLEIRPELRQNRIELPYVASPMTNKFLIDPRTTIPNTLRRLVVDWQAIMQKADGVLVRELLCIDEVTQKTLKEIRAVEERDIHPLRKE